MACGFPYISRPGLLVATVARQQHETEGEGAQFDRLVQLPYGTALGPVILARVLPSGRVIIAGPTLLCDLRSALDQLHEYRARLLIIDDTISRIEAAANSAGIVLGKENL